MYNQAKHLSDDICPLCGGPRSHNQRLVLIEGRAFWDGALLPLRNMAQDIFALLVQRRGLLVRREAIFTQLYAHRPEADWPNVHVIDAHTVRIRKVFVRYNMPFVLETVWGEGWVLRELPHDKLRNSAGETPATQRP